MKTIQELNSLNGRRILLTGATGNIGFHIAATIAELEGDLILSDLPGSDYSHLIKLIKDISDVNIETFDCQLEDHQSRENLVSYVNNNKKPLNVIINNAAFVGTTNLKGWATDFESQTVSTWKRAMEVNLTAVFDLSKGLSKKLKDSHAL